MTTALEHIRYSCGIAGEEVAEMVNSLEAELAASQAENRLLMLNLSQCSEQLVASQAEVVSLRTELITSYGEGEELSAEVEDDYDLSQDELDAKYNPDGDGEHPHFTRWDWAQVVAQRATLSGYWAWVQYKVDGLFCDCLRKETL